MDTMKAIQKMREAGVVIQVEGGQLSARATAPLTYAQRKFIGTHKEEFLRAIPDTRPETDALVVCAECVHFERLGHHPNLGHCAAGQPEAPFGNWDYNWRNCQKWHQQQ